MTTREQGQTPETIERLYGPHTHVCWTPDYTPPEQREQVVLVRLSDLERFERQRNELVRALELCYEHCRLYHREVETNNVGVAVRAALASVKGE